uniref:Uncharacterized protein n=1 Tax=Rhizophora mucronata TaxID=61149 RepID=A0A2P2P9D7_RHIMU
MIKGLKIEFKRHSATLYLFQNLESFQEGKLILIQSGQATLSSHSKNGSILLND